MLFKCTVEPKMLCLNVQFKQGDSRSHISYNGIAQYFPYKTIKQVKNIIYVSQNKNRQRAHSALTGSIQK